MEYSKAALTYEQQADLLMGCGMQAEKALLVKRLSQVSYYRLSGYWYPYRHSDGSFAEGTAFKTVWDAYTFDRRFRLVVLDAIERVEVYVRSKLAYELSHAQSPFGYQERGNLPGLADKEYETFIDHVSQCYRRSREQFVVHYKKKYEKQPDGTSKLPPYWIIVETFDFGLTSQLYKGAPKQVKKKIANGLGVQMPVLSSWLHVLNTVRNTCAHHARLWNKVIGFKPSVPKNDPAWAYVKEHNDRMYAVLTILNYLLSRIAPQTRWKARLNGLFESYPQIDKARMGFPEGWEDADLWKSAGGQS